MLRIYLLVFTFALAACSSNTPEPAAKDVPLITRATKETYLSGDAFCARYAKFTAKEIPVRVSVPKDYKSPSEGSISLYAYTLKPFDPTLPTYIYIDGGPGQNTHGLMPDYFGQSVNEIRYDQRGIGCSAPPTFEEYRDASVYSSTNNARDLDLIRQAYGVQSWTVYGVSYGTVPATMYGSMFAKNTTSVVLEGIVGDVALLSDLDFKVKKLNLFLNRLTYAQRKSFNTIVFENSLDTRVIVSNLMSSFYQDKGLATFAERLARYIHLDGTIDRAALADLRARVKARASEFPVPQQPGAVDERILTILYCKDLGLRHATTRGLSYNETEGFIAKEYGDNGASEECSAEGVMSWDESTFRPGDYKTYVPTYYFQGALDGATVAKSAYAHWQDAPLGKSYFMLAKRGGHNPNLTRLDSENTATKTMEHQLFGKAIFGIEITMDDIALFNQSQAVDEAWVLYLSKSDRIDDNLEGLRVVPKVQLDDLSFVSPAFYRVH